MPEAGLAFTVEATQMVVGFSEAAIETQIVTNGVLPTIRSRLEKREQLPGEVVDLLDLEASAVFQSQSDQETVVHWRSRPGARLHRPTLLRFTVCSRFTSVLHSFTGKHLGSDRALIGH